MNIMDEIDFLMADLEKDHKQFCQDTDRPAAHKMKLHAEMLAEYLGLYLVNLEGINCGKKNNFRERRKI